MAKIYQTTPKPLKKDMLKIENSYCRMLHRQCKLCQSYFCPRLIAFLCQINNLFFLLLNSFCHFLWQLFSSFKSFAPKNLSFNKKIESSWLNKTDNSIEQFPNEFNPTNLIRSFFLCICLYRLKCKSSSKHLANYFEFAINKTIKLCLIITEDGTLHSLTKRI